MALHEVPIVGFAADLVCPERCAACSDVVHPRVLFCRACFAHVTLLDDRNPATTGRAPLESPIRIARAWAAYDRARDASPIARAITSFKYGGARRLGRRLAAALVPRVPDRDVALIMPVPLHPRRLHQRGFNQSAVLARHLARDLGRPVALTALVRVRDTPSQVTLDPQERATNVAHAFTVARPSSIRGRTVLVIDDVWTSGATARAVATTLRAAGATAVDVLTVARVL